MGATASNDSNNNNDCHMVQRGYVTSMAGPDYHPEPNLVGGISGGGEFSNLLFQKGAQEISALNDMDMLSQMVMGGRDGGASDMTRVHDFLGVGGPTAMLPPNLHADWSWKQL